MACNVICLKSWTNISFLQKNSFEKANENNIFKNNFLRPNSYFKQLFTEHPFSYLTWLKQIKHPRTAFFSLKAIVTKHPQYPFDLFNDNDFFCYVVLRS